MKTPESSARDASSSGDDDRLEQMLRESSSAYIDDAGFTARIMGLLPAPRRGAERRRNGLLLGAAALGCGLTAVLGGANLVAFVGTTLERLAAWIVFPVPGLGATFTVGVLGCWIMTVAVGWWAWERLRSAR